MRALIEALPPRLRSTFLLRYSAGSRMLRSRTRWAAGDGNAATGQVEVFQVRSRIAAQRAASWLPPSFASTSSWAKEPRALPPKPVAPGTLYFPFLPLVVGAMHVASEDGNVRAFHRDAQEIAGGIGVGHRVGVVDVEDQGKVKRIGAGSQGFLPGFP